MVGLNLIIIWLGCESMKHGYFSTSDVGKAKIEQELLNSKDFMFTSKLTVCHTRKMETSPDIVSGFTVTNIKTKFCSSCRGSCNKCGNKTTGACIHCGSQHCYSYTKIFFKYSHRSFVQQISNVIKKKIFNTYYNEHVYYVSFSIKGRIARVPKVLNVWHERSDYLLNMPARMFEHCDAKFDQLQQNITEEDGFVSNGNSAWVACVKENHDFLADTFGRAIVPVTISNQHNIKRVHFAHNDVEFLTMISLCFDRTYFDKINNNRRDKFFNLYNATINKCYSGSGDQCKRVCGGCEPYFTNRGRQFLATPIVSTQITQTISDYTKFIIVSISGSRVLSPQGTILRYVSKDTLISHLPFKRPTTTAIPTTTITSKPPLINEEVKTELISSIASVVAASVLAFLAYCFRGKCCNVISCCCNVICGTSKSDDDADPEADELANTEQRNYGAVEIFVRDLDEELTLCGSDCGSFYSSDDDNKAETDAESSIENKPLFDKNNDDSAKVTISEFQPAEKTFKKTKSKHSLRSQFSVISGDFSSSKTILNEYNKKSDNYTNSDNKNINFDQFAIVVDTEPFEIIDLDEMSSTKKLNQRPKRQPPVVGPPKPGQPLEYKSLTKHAPRQPTKIETKPAHHTNNERDHGSNVTRENQTQNARDKRRESDTSNNRGRERDDDKERSNASGEDRSNGHRERSRVPGRRSNRSTFSANLFFDTLRGSNQNSDELDNAKRGERDESTRPTNIETTKEVKKASSPKKSNKPDTKSYIDQLPKGYVAPPKPNETVNIQDLKDRQKAVVNERAAKNKETNSPAKSSSPVRSRQRTTRTNKDNDSGSDGEKKNVKFQLDVDYSPNSGKDGTTYKPDKLPKSILQNSETVEEYESPTSRRDLDMITRENTKFNTDEFSKTHVNFQNRTCTTDPIDKTFNKRANSFEVDDEDDDDFDIRNKTQNNRGRNSNRRNSREDRYSDDDDYDDRRDNRYSDYSDDDYSDYEDDRYVSRKNSRRDSDDSDSRNDQRRDSRRGRDYDNYYSDDEY